MITSEPFAQTDDDVQRVNIDVIAGDLTGPGGAVTHRQAAYGDPNAGNEQDIILEYHYSDGWIIRHIAPYLFRSPG